MNILTKLFFNTNTKENKITSVVGVVIKEEEKKEMTITQTTQMFLKDLKYLPLRVQGFTPEDFTKDEYLEWKNNWKYIYKSLSKEIREGKNKRKMSPNGYVSELHFNRWLANHMMIARTIMKQHSIMLKEKNVLSNS